MHLLLLLLHLLHLLKLQLLLLLLLLLELQVLQLKIGVLLHVVAEWLGVLVLIVALR